jgi:excisionase family DNA binding protein
MLVAVSGGGGYFSVINSSIFISVNDAAKRLNVSKHVIYRLIDINAIKAFKPGGLTASYRIDETSLNEYISNLLDDSPFINILNEIFKNSPFKDKYVKLLVLRYMKDYTLEQVAENLGVSDTTYRTWETTALNTIKSRLKSITFEGIKDDKFALRVVAKAVVRRHL